MLEPAEGVQAKPPFPVPDDDLARKITAHHEAAHFVASVMRRRTAYIVSIKPKNGPNGYLGISSGEMGMCEGITAKDLEPILVDIFAGYYGAVRFAPEYREYCRATARDDEEQAEAFLPHVRYADVHRRCRERARRMVARRWIALSAVARALLLLETMEGYVAESLMDVVEKRTPMHEIPPHHWLRELLAQVALTPAR